jgi:hypothetical protein
MKIIRPRRVVRCYTQRLVAPPARVFPLLCPVREADWIEGWDPLVVFSDSGVAEADCAFITPAIPADAIWYITRHEPAGGELEMIKITPEVTACRLNIRLQQLPDGTEAVIRYAHTSLGPAGDAFIDAFTEAHFTEFMRQWEIRINYYLEHGRMLRGTTT